MPWSWTELVAAVGFLFGGGGLIGGMVAYRKAAIEGRKTTAETGDIVTRQYKDLLVAIEAEMKRRDEQHRIERDTCDREIRGLRDDVTALQGQVDDLIKENARLRNNARRTGRA